MFDPCDIMFYNLDSQLYQVLGIGLLVGLWSLPHLRKFEKSGIKRAVSFLAVSCKQETKTPWSYWNVKPTVSVSIRGHTF